MAKVWGEDSAVSREVLFVRRSIADALRWSGTVMLCRQPWSKSDFNAGRVGHCPECYDEVLKQQRNMRCRGCYGIGFEGGYKPAFAVRAHIQNNSANHDVGDNAGMREEQNPTIKLACDGHIYGSGDLFAEVLEISGGVPSRIGRVFQISGSINRQTVQGLVSTEKWEAGMDLTDRMVAQQGTVKLLLATDERVLCSDEFWGIGKGDNPLRTADIRDITEVTDAERNHMSSWGL